MLRPRGHLEQNRYVLIAAGAVVVAILVFVAVSMPRGAVHNPSNRSIRDQSQEQAVGNTAGPAEKSLFPIIESQRTTPQTQRDGFLNEVDLERTAKAKPSPNHPQTPQDASGSLGAIPPFGTQENWPAPPYQPASSHPAPTTLGETVRADREGMEKSSFAYVRSATFRSGSEVAGKPLPVEDIGLGLPVGSKLRARLETAVCSAVRTPVLAVIEYNYERNGEIIVPAGTKAVGRIQDADRSGFVRLQFESLLMPDGATLPLRAVATDLQMKPIRGRVEGKHSGRNILVRSLSGVGQAGAMLVGRGSLDQPLSESYMLRERISNNIGQASDEQISRMNFTQHIVVTVPADTPINVIVEESVPSTASSPVTSPETQLRSNSSAEELRRLLQLQKELGQTSSPDN